jgi:hypothetical protein
VQRLTRSLAGIASVWIGSSISRSKARHTCSGAAHASNASTSSGAAISPLKLTCSLSPTMPTLGFPRRIRLDDEALD